MGANVKTGIATLAAVIVAVAISSPSLAQQTGQGTKLSEIVVTAERREQNIQIVPASVAAIPQIELQRENINQLSDYLTAIPGIDWDFSMGPVGDRGRQNVGIRGVERANGLEASAIGFYIDDTSIEVANPRIFDLNRIEVLSGPQGTLYGASSMGGTIKLITNQPNPAQASFETNAGADTVDHGGAGWYVNQMINVPIISDKVALRIVGTMRDDPGYINNYSQTGTLVEKDINEQRAREIRASLLIKPTDKLQITPSIFYHKLIVDGQPTQCTGCGLPPYSVQQYATSESQEYFTLAGLNIKYDLGFADLVSQTSYYDYRGETNEDLTLAFAKLDGFYPVGIASTGNEKVFSEEDRIETKLNGPVQVVGGVYYSNSQRPFTSQSITPGLNAAFAAHGTPLVLPVTPQGDNYFDAVLTSHQVQYAGFAEGTWSVTRKLDLTLGGRYFDFQDNSTDFFSGYDFRSLPSSLPPSSTSEHGVDPKVNATWRPNEDLLFYATADRGFRPGNSNIELPTNCDASLTASGVTPPGPRSFTSDSIWNYEVGTKTQWFDDKLTADVTAYRMDWTNIEVTVPLPSCGIQGYVVNAGNAISEGVEFQLAAQPVPALHLSFSGAYDDAYISSPNEILKVPAGYPLIDTPLWTLSAAGQYTFPINSALQGYLHADVRFRGKTYVDFTNDQSQALTQIDLRLGLLGQTRSTRWEAALYVQNLTDANPVLGLITDRYGFPGFEYNSITPRTIGVDLTFNY